MMSPRYAWGVIVLALVALVPTVVHNYLGLTIDDGPKAASLDVRVPGALVAPTSKSVRWFEESFRTSDAVEREYTGAGGRVVRLTVIRSLDAKLLYHHPENVVAYAQALHEHSLVRIPSLSGVPVHRLRTEPGNSKRLLGLYALRYRGNWVEEPLRFQFALTASLLVNGRAPTTLLFVQTRSGVAGTDQGGFEVDVFTAAVEALLRAEATAGTQ